MKISRRLLGGMLFLIITGSSCAIAETPPPPSVGPMTPVTPFYPTSTEAASNTPTAIPSHTATATPVPVTPSPTYTPTITFTPTASTAVAIPSRELPVRSGPGLAFPIVDRVEADVAIPIYAMSDDGAWVLISSLGQDGRWLGLSPFVQLGGDWENISVWGATPTSTATATPSPTATVTPTLIPTVDVDAIVETVVAQVVGTLSVPTAVPLAAGDSLEMSADDDPFLGTEDAGVIIIEFGDLHDPYGKRFAAETLPLILENYGDQVRLVYRDYPILGESSIQAAIAAECANDQNVYWKYQQKLWEAEASFSREVFVQIAEDLKLDMPEFFACLDDEATREEVELDFDAASRAGITGVPTFFINGEIVTGAQPYEAFVPIIEAALAGASTESE